MKPKYLHSDNHPSDQPTDSYRYALNALVSNDRFINESGNIECAELPEGYSILGHVQGIDSTIVLIASLTGSQIGRIKDCEYIVELDEVDLNFSLLHQMTSVKFRVRNGCEEEIYFTDDYNPPRAVNLSKLNDYYVGGVFDASKINLLYDVQIPVINVSVNEYGGSVKMGTYNFAIRFLDEDLNATHWIDTTPVVAIYDESIYAPYTQIDGGLTLEVDPVNGLPETSKSITLELSNIDDKFTYYQIGIIAANAASGRPSSYKASPAIPITQTEYVYTGTTSDMTDLTAEEIAIPKTDIDTVRTMEVASNKLLLAGLKGKQVDFAALQRAASLIYTTYEIEEVDRKDAVALGNAKNPNTYYEKMSEMAGEVRAYGIVFLFDDGYETPPCHIAGRPANRDPRSCALISGGNTQIPAPEISNQWDTSTIANWSSELQHIVFNEDDYDGSLKRYQIYNTATKDTDTTGLMGYYQVETATYPDIRDCNGISIWGVDACGNELTGQNIRHHRMPDRRLQPQYDYDNEVIRLIGVRFHNITYPDSRIVGHYIVAAERTEENKTVLDTGVSFRYEECSDLTAYTYMHHLVGTEPYHYIAHPRFLYNGELLRGYIKVESSQHITTQTYATDIKKLTDVGQDDIYFGFRRIICDGTNAVTQHNYAITDTMKIAGASKDTLGTVDVANMSMTNNVNLFKTVDVLPTHSYVSLMVYKDVYKNIFNLRYYKIHPNMLTNSSSNLIFGGDTFINELKIMDSKIRDINPGMWGEIAAIAGIIAGLAVTILTLGAAAPAGAIIAAVAVTAATAAAIGITANAVAIHTKAIRDGIYEDCLADVALDNAVQNEFGLLDGLDKKIIIHTEYFRGLFIDSGINLDLRHENNDECGTYYKGGDVFRYLQNRLVFYNEDESKFMVKPVFCPEVYVYNRDYSRKNKEKSYTSLPIAFDYCSECLNVFPNRVAWSQTSLDEQQSDAFRIFLANNVQDLSAAYGPITNLISKAEKLYITTTDMLFYVPENLQERVTTDFATYIGTGEYLGIPPREVVDSDLGSIGCLDSFSIINTPFGTPILDSKEGIIYLLSNELKPISINGMDRFFRENLPLRSTEDINPAHPQGIGYITCYDPEERRLIITKKDFVPRDDLRVKLYRSKINGNWYYDLNFQSYPVDVNDPAYFVNYSWTVSYAMDSNKWISFHSYIPDHAFYDKKVMYTSKGNGVWSHNNDTYFNKFYGTEYPHILEIVDTQEDTAKWNNILLLTEAIKNEVEQRNTTFDGLWAYTNRQSTGKQTLKVISSDSNYIGDSVRDEFGIIRIDKRERMWNIPELYDYVTDITKSVGTTSWTYLSSEFPIDKVPNPLSTDNTKDWMGLENFRDNYLIIRFYFSLNDVLLLTKFAESNKVKST